jgi:HEAT repeat protein
VNEPPAAASPAVVQAPVVTQPPLAATVTERPKSRRDVARERVARGDAAAFDEVVLVQRSAGPAEAPAGGDARPFDADQLARLIPVERWLPLASDPSPALRQLVAAVLSAGADPRASDALLRLVRDSEIDVARAAIAGLARLTKPEAHQAVVAVLRAKGKDERMLLLESLRDGAGTDGLLLALSSVATDNEDLAYYQKKQIFDMIDRLGDPRGGNALYAYLQSKPHIHFQTRAAIALASIGDLRSVPTLAKRLRMFPLDIYSDRHDWEMLLKRDDNERVVAARMLAELAIMYPEQRSSIARQAEDALIFWIHDMPSPHANGIRALAAMGSTKDLRALRQWADPPIALPGVGRLPPMDEEFVVTQFALRYLGWEKDSWPVLEKQLNRRRTERASVDVTMAGLMHGGVAILGMSLRALGLGAAEGTSEWADHRGIRPLLDFADDAKNNEQARTAATRALAWVAEPQDLPQILQRIQSHSAQDQAAQLTRTCFVEALLQRRIPGEAPTLLPMIAEESDPEFRHQLARALARTGFDDAVQARLFEMLKGPTMNDAALATLLAGTPEAAARAVAAYARKPPAAVAELLELWKESFDFWSVDDLESGVLFRYLDNAEAVSHVVVRGKAQTWAKRALALAFDNIVFDNGPHSLTRVQLQRRLLALVRGADEQKRRSALLAFVFSSSKRRRTRSCWLRSSSPMREDSTSACVSASSASVARLFSHSLAATQSAALSGPSASFGERRDGAGLSARGGQATASRKCQIPATRVPSSRRLAGDPSPDRSARARRLFRAAPPGNVQLTRRPAATNSGV